MMKLMMMMMIERTVRAPLGQHQGKTLLAEVPGVLAVPLLASTSGEYLAKAETSLQSAKMKTMMRKFGMGMVIVMLIMKPLMMITRMRIRRTIIMIEQPVEEEVQVGSVCPPSWRWPSTGCAPGRCRSGTPAAAPPSPR